jgi:uncharacterized membrane protein YgdD (TMEM256/DUF423 family)
MRRTWIGLGSLAGLGAVTMAAVAAHLLPQDASPHTAEILRNAIQMQGWHALALVACGLWADQSGRRAARLVNCAGAAFTAGLILFCGTLYALVFADMHIAMLAPVGGTLLMLGWALLGISALLAG